MSQNNIHNTIKENMTVLCQRKSTCDEQRKITLTQFTEAACKQTPITKISDVTKIYAEANSLDGALAFEEKIFLCEAIAADDGFKRAATEILIGMSEDIPQDVHGRIAYVKNAHNDTAFQSFAPSVKNARSFYAPTFADCCEAVFDNKCEYCILPIENSEGSKLYSFYSLIDQYELKICSTVRCGTADSQDVIYALVAKNISSEIGGAARLRFEFTVICNSNEYIDGIITVLRHLCGSIHSLGTHPVEYDPQKQKYFFSVDVSRDALAPLLIYVENEYPRYTPIGLYKIDKEN